MLESGSIRRWLCQRLGILQPHRGLEAGAPALKTPLRLLEFALFLGFCGCS